MTKRNRRESFSPFAGEMHLLHDDKIPVGTAYPPADSGKQQVYRPYPSLYENSRLRPNPIHFL